MVLSHPKILLHNNLAELGATQWVRKRDVSLQARTREGIGAWDTFQTLVATAKKLGVNLFHYVLDRILGTHALPSFATLIGEQAQLLALGSSWQQGPCTRFSPHPLHHSLPSGLPKPKPCLQDRSAAMPPFPEFLR